MSSTINPSVVSALHTLGIVDTNLKHALSEVATGKTVATLEDNSAAYVIANGLDSDTRAFTAVGSGLGAASVPTRVANTAVGGITNVVTSLKEAVIQAQAGGEFATAHDTRIQALLSRITGYEADATVNGVNLVAGAVENGVQKTQIRVPADLDGGTITIGDMGLSRMNASLPGLGLSTISRRRPAD